MIIWSRWGIVVLLFLGLGVLLGFTLADITGMRQPSGPVNGVFIGLGFILSGGALWLFNRFVVGTYIDKPQPAVILERLATPEIDPQTGGRRTHRQIPVLHPDTGQQIFTNPVSSFFFIPIRFWVVVLPALGVVVAIVNVITAANAG